MFENVTFNDPNQPHIVTLDNFSLSIESGESVAIVGANLMEQRAIVDLMERFYNPISGKIVSTHVIWSYIHTYTHILYILTWPFGWAVEWGIETNGRFEAERPPISVGPLSGGRTASSVPYVWH